MRILAIDTSSPICSVAILENDNLIDEINLDDGRTHSENLMPLIDSILKRNNLDIKDIEMISCCPRTQQRERHSWYTWKVKRNQAQWREIRDAVAD